MFVVAVFVLLLLALAWGGEYLRRVHDLPAPLDSQSHGEWLRARIGSAALSDRVVTDVVMQETADVDCGQGLFGGFSAARSITGYVPYGDPTALSGLRANCARLDSVVYEAFSFGKPGAGIWLLGPSSAAFPLADFVSGWKSRNRPLAYPVLKPENGAPDALLAELFAPGSAFMDALGNLDLAHVDGGLCLDMSAHPGIAPEALMPVLDAMRARLAPEGLGTCLIGRADAVFWDAAPLVALVERAIVLGFQAPRGPSQPIAPQQWLEQALATVRQQVPAEKLTIAVATFAQAWQSGLRRPERLSYAEAMLRAHVYDGEIRFNPDPGNSVIHYLDDRRRVSQIWLADATSFHNARASIGAQTPIALWPLGYEDPTLWTMLEKTGAQSPAKALLEAPIDFRNHAVVEGSGPFSIIITAAAPGQREVETSARTGQITAQSYLAIPRPYRIGYFGDEGAPARLAVKISGLGGRWATNELLQILDARGISATFFLSTRDLLSHHELIPDLLASGHGIGTRVVPRPARSAVAAYWNLARNNIPQHYLAHEFGVRSVIVENPSQFGQLPGNKAVLDQLQAMLAQGYLPVHASLAAPYGRFNTEAYLERVRDAARARPVNVMSFDFGRLNDQATLTQLPGILDALQGEGFQFQPLAQMAGLTPGEAVRAVQIAPLRRDTATYRIMRISWISIQNIVFLLVLIVALRSPVYLTLAFMRRRKYPVDKDFAPQVTVIIPAYNEEKVIERSVRSVLQSDYENFEIVVVDDGSADNTAAVVARTFQSEPRVSLWSEVNHGKWFAENLGMAATEAPIIIIVDADTLLRPDAIGLMVQPFKDERVGAVAGTVEIGNRDNFLTACQVIEYMYTQNVLRRAYEVLDGIIVVPGAIGAWRLDAVKKAGGVSGDTITEDADLTLAVHRAGYKVAYQPAAKSFTEAPSTVRAFLRQRLRWSFGMFQVSWKHKRSVIEGLPVGFFSLVDAVWYSLITSLIYPFVDTILLIGFGVWAYALATEGFAGFEHFPIAVSYAYLALAAVDMANVLAAFWFAGRFEWKLFLIVPLLRFGYRQLLYISSIRSIGRALVGRMSSWHKLRRTGTAVLRG